MAARRSAADMDEADHKLNHATLAQLARAGAVTEIRAIGQSGGWLLAVSFGAQSGLTLCAQRSGEPRLFARFESLVSYLQGLGIGRFEVEAAGFEAKAAPTRRRPDRAEALRRVHRAAAFEAPLPPALAAALQEAEAPAAQWLSHKDLKREWAAARETFLSEEASS
jgi:hypothetical protein